MENFKERFDKLLIDKLGVSQEDIKPEAKFTDEDTETINTVSDAETYLIQKISNK